MNDIFVHESPIECKEGASFAIGITVNGGTTMTASTSAIYKNNTDKSSDILTGSDSRSGNVATSKTMTFATGTAGTYIYVNVIVIDGITWPYACMIIVTRASAVQ
jgi:hypothetical protein